MFFKNRSPQISTEDQVTLQIMQTMDRTSAIIHFDLDGTILTANQNFLDAMGYSLDELVGNKHKMFVEASLAESQEYQDFWADLRSGKHKTNQFKRLRKDGSEIWIQATYSGVFDKDGNVERVVKFATDVTKRRKSIEKIANGLDQLSNGNLTYRLEQFGIEDLDHISDAFNDATSQLSSAMGLIGKVSSTAGTTIQKVNTSSEELSQRTGHQAATLEETAASLEKLTERVKSSADSARDAEQMSQDARVAASNSEKVVSRSIDAMDNIKKSSNEISKIISVIDDIAFQTNLLALNAGVEAARAGDGGKGFAVVASEVGSLAQRSQEAAAEIKILISQSSEQVAQGVEMVHGAGAELRKIIASVSEVADKITDFVEATSAQTLTLTDINSSVGELDKVTQQNNLMVEEVTVINKQLNSNLDEMLAQVNMFTIGPSKIELDDEDAEMAAVMAGQSF